MLRDPLDRGPEPDDRLLIRQDFLRPDGVREAWTKHHYDLHACPGACGGWHISYHYGFWGSLRKSWHLWFYGALFIVLMILLFLFAPVPGPDQFGEGGWGL